MLNRKRKLEELEKQKLEQPKLQAKGCGRLNKASTLPATVSKTKQQQLHKEMSVETNN